MRLFAPIFLFTASTAIACVSTGSTSDSSQASKVFALSDEQKSCERNEDCILFAADCCGCNQGGKQGAVNKKFANHLKKSKQHLCKTTVCMQMISNDPSCKAKSAICVNGSCVPK